MGTPGNANRAPRKVRRPGGIVLNTVGIAKGRRRAVYPIQNSLSCANAIVDISNKCIRGRYVKRWVKSGKDVDRSMMGISCVVWRWMILSSVVLVYFAMPPQVGDNREVAATAINFACERCKC